jgi:hypothetical protein
VAHLFAELIEKASSAAGAVQHIRQFTTLIKIGTPIYPIFCTFVGITNVPSGPFLVCVQSQRKTKRLT